MGSVKTIGEIASASITEHSSNDNAAASDTSSEDEYELVRHDHIASMHSASGASNAGLAAGPTIGVPKPAVDDEDIEALMSLAQFATNNDDASIASKKRSRSNSADSNDRVIQGGSIHQSIVATQHKRPKQIVNTKVRVGDPGGSTSSMVGQSQIRVNSGVIASTVDAGVKHSVMPAHNRCSRHVAIAYYIYYQQRAQLMQSQGGNRTNNPIVMDPTLEARRLKERSDWMKRTQSVAQQQQSIISAHQPIQSQQQSKVAVVDQSSGGPGISASFYNPAQTQGYAPAMYAQQMAAFAQQNPAAYQSHMSIMAQHMQQQQASQITQQHPDSSGVQGGQQQQQIHPSSTQHQQMHPAYAAQFPAYQQSAIVGQFMQPQPSFGNQQMITSGLTPQQMAHLQQFQVQQAMQQQAAAQSAAGATPEQIQLAAQTAYAQHLALAQQRYSHSMQAHAQQAAQQAQHHHARQAKQAQAHHFQQQQHMQPYAAVASAAQHVPVQSAVPAVGHVHSLRQSLSPVALPALNAPVPSAELSTSQSSVSDPSSARSVAGVALLNENQSVVSAAVPNESLTESETGAEVLDLANVAAGDNVVGEADQIPADNDN